MRTIAVVIVLLLSTNFVVGQSRDSILYIFSDSVEMEISNYLSKYSEENSFIFYLTELEDDFFSLDVINYKKNEVFFVSWHKSSNRYAVVNELRIPVLLDYDFQFSTKDNQNIGSFGKREGNIKRSFLIAHSPKIIFDKKGYIKKHLP